MEQATSQRIFREATRQHTTITTYNQTYGKTEYGVSVRRMAIAAVAFSILLAGGNSWANCFLATPAPLARHNDVIGSLLPMASTRPPPRRTLKKRRSNNRRRRVDGKSENDDPSMEHNFEVKPIRRRDAVEQGLDYWIDEEDINRNKASESRPAKTIKRSSEQMSQEKLKAEIVAPYTQNWIGYLSLTVVILATIVKQFPELLAIPIIPIPDL